MKILLSLFIFCMFQSLYAKDYNLLDYSATPDGENICTDLIQNAINNCSASGGGTVTIPTGKFLTGTIFLKNNVTLYLENGAVLLGSSKIEDYKPKYLITAVKADNISIKGDGIIDGRGYLHWIPSGRKSYSHNSQSPGNLIRLGACRTFNF
jgi:polygalacturonase